MIPAQLIEDCQILVNEGVDQLKMPIGIVSHIYNDWYEIITINSDIGEFIGGALFALNGTYCRDVFRSQKTLAITEIDGVLGMKRHPLYVSLPLEAYISAPIRHNNEVWGTVNFTSPECRKAFSKEEVQLVQGYADRISQWLADIDQPENRPTA
ncbi:MAG: GAF domain-containing protein [Lentimonas sp.]|jgi:GAF domain-containing protein